MSRVGNFVVLSCLLLGCVTPTYDVSKKCPASTSPAAPVIKGAAVVKVGETESYSSDASGVCGACLVNGGESECYPKETYEWGFNRGVPAGGDVDMSNNDHAVCKVKGKTPGAVTLQFKLYVKCENDRIADCGGDTDSVTVKKVINVIP